MADVTDVPAGAYTLPACKFMPPDSKRFIGWATTASGTATAAGGTITVSDNVTLYAILGRDSHNASGKAGGKRNRHLHLQRLAPDCDRRRLRQRDDADLRQHRNKCGQVYRKHHLKSGRWADGTSAPVTVEWTIQRKAITPTIRVSGTYTYTGTPVIPTFTVEDGGKVLSLPSTAEHHRQ